MYHVDSHVWETKEVCVYARRKFKYSRAINLCLSGFFFFGFFLEITHNTKKVLLKDFLIIEPKSESLCQGMQKNTLAFDNVSSHRNGKSHWNVWLNLAAQ